MIPPLLQKGLSDYRARLERALPGRIRRVVLFGSWARGTAHEESDVDVLVLIANGTSRERLHAVELGAEVGFDHHLVIEPVALSDAQWAELERRERRFAREIVAEGLEVRP